MYEKTSTEIGSISKIVGEEKAIEYVAKAGFTAWDFSMLNMVKYDWVNRVVATDNDHPLASKNAEKFALKLRRIGEDNGIRCNQSHAPFPTKCKEIRDSFKKAIYLTAVAGGEACVIHPDNNLSTEENAEMYLELLPFAKEHGVKIATENMWNWDKIKDHALPAACSDEKSFKELLDAVNDEYFVACVDIGHAEMKGLGTSAAKMITALKDKVKVLHIHDNDKWHDSHQIPFSMDIDFYSVAKALKEINYDGYFTLEADVYLKEYTKENVLDGVKNLYASVKRFKEIFDE